MHMSYVRFLAPKDVPYTFNGKNLFEYRKSELRPVARSLGVADTGTHNDLLNGIMHRLDTLEAPKEIADLAASEPEAKKKAKKKNAKKD